MNETRSEVWGNVPNENSLIECSNGMEIWDVVLRNSHCTEKFISVMSIPKTILQVTHE